MQLFDYNAIVRYNNRQHKNSANFSTRILCMNVVSVISSSDMILDQQFNQSIAFKR